MSTACPLRAWVGCRLTRRRNGAWRTGLDCSRDVLPVSQLQLHRKAQALAMIWNAIMGLLLAVFAFAACKVAGDIDGA